jgi:hypothetical protein
VNLGLYSGTNYNLCSTSAACSVNWDYEHPTNGKLFNDYTRGIFKIRPTNPAYLGGLDGESIGADFQQLPMVRSETGTEGPTIRTSVNRALFTMNLHSPLAPISCSLEVSTTRDMDNTLTYSEPALLTDIHDRYPRTATRRYIVADGLAASTTYWYRLHCAAIYEGSFTTASSSASGLVTVARTAQATSDHRIVSGVTYSRSADAFTTPQYGGWVSCTSGQPCTVTANLAADIVWYRLETQSGYKYPLDVIVH